MRYERELDWWVIGNWNVENALELPSMTLTRIWLFILQSDGLDMCTVVIYCGISESKCDWENLFPSDRKAFRHKLHIFDKKNVLVIKFW